MLSRDDPVIARGNVRSQGGLGVDLGVDARQNAYFNHHHLRRRRRRLIHSISRLDTHDILENPTVALMYFFIILHDALSERADKVSNLIVNYSYFFLAFFGIFKK